jgi:phosphoribosylamine--glycine ligase
MGAYSPAPVVTGEIHGRIMEEILKPMVQGMAQEGRPYRGVLYAGIMVRNGLPRVLEFNARLGDPETQPIVVRMKGDIIPVLEACIDGNLSQIDMEWDSRPSVCVVMASKGYPGKYEKGKVIQGLEVVSTMKDIFIFHAGTAFEGGRVVTNGGRVLGVTALGEDIPKAIERAYEAIRNIYWDGVHYRTDIGQKALLHSEKD